jgi:hypothetical protein
MLLLATRYSLLAFLTATGIAPDFHRTSHLIPPKREPITPAKVGVTAIDGNIFFSSLWKCGNISKLIVADPLNRPQPF